MIELPFVFGPADPCVDIILDVQTDDGLVGLGEMGGGGEAATAAFHGLGPYLVGRDPARIEEMRFLIANPTASLHNNRTQIVAALEFACLDLLGQKWGVPLCEILGGRLRDRLLGVAVHSCGGLGIQLATMLHMGAVRPNLTFAADAHDHHLANDVIAGGKMKYEGGAIAVPMGPGLGPEVPL